mgnify:CR=1 FL=1
MEINLDIIDHILNNNYELSRDFEKYGKIYLNTTENIAGILEGLDIKGKKVLSVAGSGDQVLNAFYHGAEEVSIFDINPLAAAQAELKLVAAQKLDYNEFYHFFTPVTNSVLDVDTFNKLSKYLTDECANFFEYLYSNYDSILIFNKVFHKFFPTKCILERINSYMGEENFKQLKEKIDGKKIDYIESGLVELIIKLKDLYDIILLSNISDSVDEIWTIDSLNVLYTV